MSKSFQIKIEPYEFYNKYASQDYVLCGIRFVFLRMRSIVSIANVATNACPK